LLTSTTEASRAKHKFAVKRNCWPKTRGVAMNPVDHPHGGVSNIESNFCRSCLTLVLYRVTTNISVKPPPSLVTPPRVKRLVSSLPDGLVCCVVPRRSRSRAFTTDFMGLGLRIALIFGLVCSGTKGGHDEKYIAMGSTSAFTEYKKKDSTTIIGCPSLGTPSHRGRNTPPRRNRCAMMDGWMEMDGCCRGRPGWTLPGANAANSVWLRPRYELTVESYDQGRPE
jgi:large subunit ribosomal protein L8e